MRYFGWGTAAGLAMAGLLVAAQPAHAEGTSAAGQTSPDKSTTDKSTDKMGGTGTSHQMEMGSSASKSADTGAQQLTGTVQKFDKDSKELTLADSDKKLRVSDDTKIMKDGQQGSISDIKEGAQVRASYSGTGDTLQVNRLEVMSSGAPAKTPKTPGAAGTSPTDTK